MNPYKMGKLQRKILFIYEYFHFVCRRFKMKLTKSTIQQYIKEEMATVIQEQDRSQEDIQKDLNHAIKTYNHWGTKDKNSQEFANAKNAVEKFRNEKQAAAGAASKEPSGAPAGGWGYNKPRGHTFRLRTRH